MKPTGGFLIVRRDNNGERDFSLAGYQRFKIFVTTQPLEIMAVSPGRETDFHGGWRHFAWIQLVCGQWTEWVTKSETTFIAGFGMS